MGHKRSDPFGRRRLRGTGVPLGEEAVEGYTARNDGIGAEEKKNRTERAPRKSKLPRNTPSRDVVDKVATSAHGSTIPETPIVRLDSKIQQAKKFAVTQAQQEGCLGNYRSFDSLFGNYLVPVIPTHADLTG